MSPPSFSRAPSVLLPLGSICDPPREVMRLPSESMSPPSSTLAVPLGAFLDPFAPCAFPPFGSMSPPSFAAGENRRDETSSRNTWIRFNTHCGAGAKSDSRGAAAAGATTATTTKVRARKRNKRRIAVFLSRGRRVRRQCRQPPPSEGNGNRLLLQVCSEEATTRALADMERHDECPDRRTLPCSTNSRYAQPEKLKLARELNLRGGGRQNDPSALEERTKSCCG